MFACHLSYLSSVEDYALPFLLLAGVCTCCDAADFFDSTWHRTGKEFANRLYTLGIQRP